jgi:transcription-repair coupling factor (superfamily II helicase)
MKSKLLQDFYLHHPAIGALSRTLGRKTIQQVYVEGVKGSAVPLLFSALFQKKPRTYLFVLPDKDEAAYFYHDLMQAGAGKTSLFFPSSYKRSIKYGQKDAANEILRTEVLSRIQSEEPLCIVSYPEALAERVVTKEELAEKILTLEKTQVTTIDTVANALFEFGFERVDYVYEPGQYTVRGSLIDVYSFSNEYPYRIDFFGDEIDSIRTFEVDNQLTKEQLQKITIVPQIRQSADGKGVSFLECIPKEAILAAPNFEQIKEALQYLFEDTVSHQARIVQEEVEQSNLEFLNQDQLMDGYVFEEQLKHRMQVEFGLKSSFVPEATVSFKTSLQPAFHKKFDLVSETLLEFQEQGYALYILSESAKQIDRIHAIFEERGDEIVFKSMAKTIHTGFVDHDLKICLFTDHQLFDRYHKYNLKSDHVRSGKMALTLKELQEFQVGDYVVHIDHGVGQFGGLVRIPSGNSTQEVIKITFKNDDAVFVSIHALHKVSKYKGKDGAPPRINKLGTGAWQRIKEKTKKKIKDIARDLIKLYAKRREEKGYAFSADSFMQKELEASFIYEDTPDQLKVTQDVKTDMESVRPMDRLVCGDVGFGKTEIAIRAAFKAVADSKQVALLVPTTVLAYQHYKTLSTRLKEFPCRVEYLSRARKASEVKQIIKDLAKGEVDILVGTHRLIGKDVMFKDLGLLIIDEEQKFGVAVKEKLKQLKVNVDTLTLTATPIPRTLQFSLMGARDLSTIQTPPPNRYPIQTELHTFNEDIIREAINFEISRNGQVFVVNNRIQNIYDLSDRIQRWVPDARIVIGHGQMEPKQLEKIILDFVNYDYDILIATSIIESGIDIPNVNTIIINNAQNFGLSDLHQLRGRVGRGNKKAFCYLLAPPLSVLTPEAKRRLQAIENFSDLGSGIHIAMQDLDIRGAGNMLGAEQSGFIADLGYETYQKVLTEAVNELKVDEFADLYEEVKAETSEDGTKYVSDCQIESDMELLFPHDYIPSSSERMLLYRELDNLETDEEVEAFKTRLIDRFGRLPRETEELLRVVRLRSYAKRLGVERVFLKAQRMTLFYVSKLDSAFYQSDAFGKSISYISLYTKKCNLREKNGKRSMVIKGVETVEQGVKILQEIDALEV